MGLTEIANETISKNLSGPLNKFGFLGLFGNSKPVESQDSMPIYSSTSFNDQEVVEFVERELISKARECHQMPLMDEGLAKETRRSLCELYWNVFQHAESPVGGVFAGQYQRFDSEFQICICDNGHGIAKCVQMSGYPDISTTDALKWSLEMGNSTANTGNPSGFLKGTENERL